MQLPIVGGAYQGRSKNLSDQVCQNLYPVLDQNNKYVAAMYNTPGLVEWLDLSNTNEIRAMRKVGSVLYVVCGTTIYSVTTAGVATALTGDTIISTGNVFLAHNETYLVIVTAGDGKGYTVTLTGTTVTEIADADFPVATSLTYQDTYFIVTQSGTGSIYISASEDPTSWNALDFSTAEGHPDDSLIVYSHLRELWILGEETTEIFYNSGDTDFPFERIQGSFNDKGIGAVRSLADEDNFLFFLGDDLSVYRSEGLQLRRISTEQIEYQIAQLTTVSDAVGFAYKQEAHTFYVLSFPTEDKTFVYDIATDLWHTRATNTNDTRHPVNTYIWFNDKHLVGHMSNGKIYYYDLAIYADDSTTIRRVRRARSVHADRKWIFHHCLEIEFEAGIGLVTGQGSSPQAMLRWSDDDGHTWSNEHWTTIGAIGVYKNRARWKKLGKSRNRIYEISVSDPVKCVILSAQLDATVGAT